VKKDLEPRRLELEKLLNGLEAENHPSTMKTNRPLGPLLLVLAVCIIAVIAHAAMKVKPAASIEAIRKQYDLPALAVVTATLSAFLPNATTILFIVPVTFVIAADLGVPAISAAQA